MVSTLTGLISYATIRKHGVRVLARKCAVVFFWVPMCSLPATMTPITAKRTRYGNVSRMIFSMLSKRSIVLRLQQHPFLPFGSEKKMTHLLCMPQISLPCLPISQECRRSPCQWIQLFATERHYRLVFNLRHLTEESRRPFTYGRF